MKIFRFDPQTGRRAELLRETKLASWTSAYDKDAVARSARPDFGRSADATFHLDAGGTLPNGDDVSYKDANRWVCFCIGREVNSWDGGRSGKWQWVILAPMCLANLLTDKTDKEEPTNDNQ